MSIIENKSVLITGACGTIGKALVHELVNNKNFKAEKIIAVDNNEQELFFLDQQYMNNPDVYCHFVDIRSEEDLENHLNGVSIVFHLAALKHVALTETGPEQAIKTNIEGVKNVISASRKCNVETVVFTSSDKAVNPTNVMGASKLMGEKLVTAANSSFASSSTVMYSTRFGNVLGSSGSVIPIFREQIATGGPVTLTDQEMTRFVMSIHQSVNLILNTLPLAKGGEVFITKMPVIRISDLAEVMIEVLSPQFGNSIPPIKITGLKPGEKMYEELMNSEEVRRTIELEKYFVILPAFTGLYSGIDYKYDRVVSEKLTKPYISSSEQSMNKKDLLAFLNQNKLLETPTSPDHPSSRYWPGDKK